jgi:DNA-binding MarR family transcriptional regulator
MLSREDRPLTIDEISNWSLREFNSVSTLINKMEKDGLIKKTKRNGDTKTYITLTKEGANLYNHEITERSIHLIFNSLSADERTQLHDLLKKVRDITRDILGIDFKPPFLP